MIRPRISKILLATRINEREKKVESASTSPSMRSISSPEV
jgi:hypothetical protein